MILFLILIRFIRTQLRRSFVGISTLSLAKNGMVYSLKPSRSEYRPIDPVNQSSPATNQHEQGSVRRGKEKRRETQQQWKDEKERA
jgi:hypothetical protein